MEDAQCVEALFLLVAQVVVGGIRAGELGLAAAGGQDVRAEHGRLGRDLVLGAVDVPEDGALEVLGRGGLRRVEGDLVDGRRRGRLGLADVVELLGEHDLGLVVEVELAEHEDAVLLEGLHGGGGELVVHQQPIRLDPEDLGAHAPERARGQRAHRYQPPFTLICWPVM